jgi:hypothetical protein
MRANVEVESRNRSHHLRTSLLIGDRSEYCKQLFTLLGIGGQKYLSLVLERASWKVLEFVLGWSAKRAILSVSEMIKERLDLFMAQSSFAFCELFPGIARTLSQRNSEKSLPPGSDNHFSE